MENVQPTILMMLVVAPIIFQGCASVYKPVHPEMLFMNDHRWTGPDTCVEIELHDHVLEGSRNKRYAKMEKRNGVNLIALKIHNEGNQDVYLPYDLKVSTLNGDAISFMTVEDGLGDLLQGLDLDHSNSFVEVETDPAWILNSWFVGNDVRKVWSHLQFIKNITNEYLEECVLHPGEEFAGFVVLPIEKGTPFQISIR